MGKLGAVGAGDATALSQHHANAEQSVIGAKQRHPTVTHKESQRRRGTEESELQDGKTSEGSVTVTTTNQISPPTVASLLSFFPFLSICLSFFLPNLSIILYFISLFSKIILFFLPALSAQFCLSFCLPQTLYNFTKYTVHLPPATLFISFPHCLYFSLQLDYFLSSFSMLFSLCRLIGGNKNFSEC